MICIKGAYGNSLPDNKNLDLSKFKAFANDKMNVPHRLQFVLGRTENISGKGENAPIILYNVFYLILQIFLFLEAFKCNTTSLIG